MLRPAKFVAALASDPAIQSLVGRKSSALAASEAAWPFVVSATVGEVDRSPVLVVTPTARQASELAAQLESLFLPGQVEYLPDWETLPFERMSPTVATMGKRLEILYRIAAGEELICVTSIKAAIQRQANNSELVPIRIVNQGSIDQPELISQLVEFGYRREPKVESKGEFAVRGSIVDIYPSTFDSPVRLDLWGDSVERLASFSISSQRSENDLEDVAIFPCREMRPNASLVQRAAQLKATEPWGVEQWTRLADEELFDGMESWLPWLVESEELIADAFGDDSLVVLVEPGRCRDRARDVREEEADLAKSLATTWLGEDDKRESFPTQHVGFERMLANCKARVINVASVAQGPDTAKLAELSWEPPGEKLVQHLQRRVADKNQLVVSCAGATSAKRMAQTLSGWGIDVDLVEELRDVEAANAVAQGSIGKGLFFSAANLAILSDSDLSGRRSVRPKRVSRTQSKEHFDGLSKGDLVVHHQHGVGRYAGMVTRAIGGVESDYLLIEYRGDDKLYLPTDQIDSIRRFTTGDTPKLNKLGGAEFAKAKARVASEVSKIAQELVVLYQKRVTASGFAYSPDTPWQKEIEDAFPFELTPDQQKAVEAIKSDMEAVQPMDRLVVGDVGFGKTEVALRAVFKAVQDQKQVAILVPTTLLAQQHFQTFSDRFSQYPVRVEVVSRFNTAAQNKQILNGVKSGEVDVLVGTHRLLSQDVTFASLGLLVVDEEQRFGVSHKEKIKEFQTGVDVLTLSATPIPRTLEMSLTGIRDLSLLNTPPAERQPILTYVGEYDERPVAEAIRRELLREGQVFFVHNRVASIEKVAQDLRNLVPEARIAVAHGQMDEAILEEIVVDFWDYKYDVLVCTTIIESGIDMPSVNTLVVDRAELLGLGQLHQLRGRVGRSTKRAYAYLFNRPDASLSADAYERLKTIGESTELGSGFKIAMRDLEIRGAGNLLGTGQSGHISAVGYDLYCQMVTEAVAQLKGEDISTPEPIKIDLPLDAYLDKAYIADERARIAAYRDLADAKSTADVDDLRNAWLDQYGEPDSSAEALIMLAKIRVLADRLGIKEMTHKKGSGFGGPDWFVTIPEIDLKVSQQLRISRLYKGSVMSNARESERQHVQLAIRGSDVASKTYELLKSLVADLERA